MKHFQNIIEVAPPVTYDTMHTVTLSLSDWLNVQTYLSFYSYNIIEKGAGYAATSEKVRDLVERLADQTDAALTAAADTAEGE